ncbi:MAG: 6-phosphofructokinase [Oscillospiraceae bacterium]|nr:6-phosphofructokinase [Oscillospiraceae bacterium]
MNRIGILTSGGDAPGMNAAIRAIVREARHRNIDCLGIRRGYNGLLNGDVIELKSNDVNGLLTRGGTALFTARCQEFITPEGVEKGYNACKYLGLDGVVAIGGDGTFRGALDLSRMGVNMMCLPATIDNDIGCTNYSIGFDTACNTAIDAIDKLRDTMQSHERCSVVEVMGRDAGHLAVYVGIATGAVATLVPEYSDVCEETLIEKIRAERTRGRTHFLIIVAEGFGKAETVAQNVSAATGIDSRVTILGHIQRGGSPTARDRVTASRMGRHAVLNMLEGKCNRVVGVIDGNMQDFAIEEALKMKRALQRSMYDTAIELASM